MSHFSVAPFLMVPVKCIECSPNPCRILNKTHFPNLLGVFLGVKWYCGYVFFKSLSFSEMYVNFTDK